MLEKQTSTKVNYAIRNLHDCDFHCRPFCPLICCIQKESKEKSRMSMG